MARPRTAVDVRFWRYVSPEPNTGCWLWTGAAQDSGYGVLQIDNRAVRAHRVAWALSNGPIPAGLLVLHKCDNHPCVNPSHLFLGTNADNMADKCAKGRQARGSCVAPRPACGAANGRAKLTAEAVREARRRYVAGGVRIRDLASDYGVSPGVLGKAIRGALWRSVA